MIIQVEGRADGIFTEDGAVYIDEIKGTYGNVRGNGHTGSGSPCPGYVLRTDLGEKEGFQKSTFR